MGGLSEELSLSQAYERDELHRAFRRLLGTVDGKRVLLFVLAQCALEVDPYTGEDNATNFMLGRQNVARRLIATMDDIDPRLYPQLLLDIAEIREVDRSAVESLTKKQENDDDLEG